MCSNDDIFNEKLATATTLSTSLPVVTHLCMGEEMSREKKRKR